MTATDAQRAIDAVWRIESPKLIAGLARIVRDVGLAEDLAHDALVAALEQWPQEGVPRNPGAWLMATAKHRAIDHFRRSKLLERKHEQLGYELESDRETDRAAISMRHWTMMSETTCCGSCLRPAIQCSPPKDASR